MSILSYEQALEEKRDRVLAECGNLAIGDPIAVEVGSTENDMIILDTFFMGITANNRVQFIWYANPNALRPCVIVPSADPADVRTGGITGQRAGMFDDANGFRIAR